MRSKLNIDEDSLDFEVLNFIGIESLDKSSMSIYPNLRNCENFMFSSYNRILYYFVVESIIFMCCKAARKIIRI